ncbi:hypothetical protein L6164_026164 [Bauhinia variegata]|nr:hypothetical protein L6164_026164 [Bauhinia variegata]
MLGVGQRHKDLDQEQENVRQPSDNSNSGEGDTRGSKKIEVDLRQMGEDVDPQDEGTSKDGVGWRGSNKHPVKGKDIADSDYLRNENICLHITIIICVHWKLS